MRSYKSNQIKRTINSDDSIVDNNMNNIAAYDQYNTNETLKDASDEYDINNENNDNDDDDDDESSFVIVDLGAGVLNMLRHVFMLSNDLIERGDDFKTL